MSILRREDFYKKMDEILDEVDGPIYHLYTHTHPCIYLANLASQQIRASTLIAEYSKSQNETKNMIAALKTINEDGSMDKAICILSNLKNKKELKI